MSFTQESLSDCGKNCDLLHGDCLAPVKTSSPGIPLSLAKVPPRVEELFDGQLALIAKTEIPLIPKY
jgi:hypothetical protein